MIDQLVTPLAILLALLVWTFFVILLEKKGVLDRLNMSRIWFLALMWRTKKGTGIIEKVAGPKKFWITVANFGFVLFFTGMVLMYIMLAVSAFITLSSRLVQPVGAKEVLVLPGINPYVPLIYGLIGLIVAVVAHELTHGIIAKAEGFKVKALGLLFILIPIGAFMEPDDEEVEKGPRRSRMRLFTGGPMANFLLAFLFLGIFSWGMMSGISAQDDPMIITDIATTSPFHTAMGEHPKAIYSINGTAVHSYEDLYDIEGIEPGTWVITSIKVDGERRTFPAVAGILVSNVGEDTPANEVSMKEGSILLSLDGAVLYNSSTFHEIMESTEKGQIIDLIALVPYYASDGKSIVLNGTDPFRSPSSDLAITEDNMAPTGFQNFYLKEYSIILDDKYDHIPLRENRGKGYIGIASSYMGLAGVGSDQLIDQVAHPIRSADSVREGFFNVIYITFSLPLQTEIMPFHDPLTDIYEVEGLLSFMPDGIFWFLANTMFYIFWLNILLGLFNALPMIPLDGGFVFRDAMVLILNKILRNKKEEDLERIAKRISSVASFSVLGLILISIFWPWIRVLFF
ncbi:MAG: site-2 protease family protein [Candidatus Thermoplasmatota archaeon]|nr:site-2 protease family protein [Candidatus Thermoplasmatota archaeon]